MRQEVESRATYNHGNKNDFKLKVNCPLNNVTGLGSGGGWNNGSSWLMPLQRVLGH